MSSSLRWQTWAKNREKVTTESLGEGSVSSVSASTGTGRMIFPHCPRCSSYALYRRNNQGDYECESCGLQGISGQVARRVQ